MLNPCSKVWRRETTENKRRNKISWKSIFSSFQLRWNPIKREIFLNFFCIHRKLAPKEMLKLDLLWRMWIHHHEERDEIWNIFTEKKYIVIWISFTFSCKLKGKCACGKMLNRINLWWQNVRSRVWRRVSIFCSSEQVNPSFMTRKILEAFSPSTFSLVGISNISHTSFSCFKFLDKFSNILHTLFVSLN